MKRLLPFLSLVALLALSGCGPSDKRMAERFPDEESHIMTDEKGRLYIVEHRVLDVYFIRPYEPEKAK